jgi:hypothetical protein
MASFRTIDEIGVQETRIALELHACGPLTAPPEERLVDPLGTAAIIAPHLAITCKHAVMPYLDQLPAEPGGPTANFNLTALMFMEDNRTDLLPPRVGSAVFGIGYHRAKGSVVGRTESGAPMFSVYRTSHSRAATSSRYTNNSETSHV